MKAAGAAAGSEAARPRLGIGGHKQGEQGQDDDAGDHGGTGLEVGLEAKAVQIRRARGELEGAGGPSLRHLRRDRGIERNGPITGDRVDGAGVSGLAD